MKRVGEETYFYDTHDGKMIYILTQHSLYIRKHYPELLCKCKRGTAVKDPDHVCKFITHEEYICADARSLRRWTKIMDSLRTDKIYDYMITGIGVMKKMKGCLTFELIQITSELTVFTLIFFT